MTLLAVASHDVSGVPFAALGLMLLLLAVNGMLVAMEFALLATPRTRLEPLAEEGRYTARAALGVMGRLGTVLAGTQLGITIASLALGAVAEPALGGVVSGALEGVGVPEGAASTAGLIVGVGIVVFLHLLLGEMVPKSVALARPEGTAMLLAPIVSGFVALCRPVLWLLNGLARLGTRALGVEPADELLTHHTAAELEVMVDESSDEGLLDPEEAVLLRRALTFVERPVSEVMVPLGEVTAIPERATPAEVEAVVRASGHTRVLVGDGLKGFVHAKDLLRLTGGARDEPLPVGVVRPTLRVAPDDTLGNVLRWMRVLRRHVGVVVEPGDGTLGLVTLEDVLESIVGDIVDETDVA